MNTTPDLSIPVRHWDSIQGHLDALRNIDLPAEQKAALLPVILALETNIGAAKTDVINHMLVISDFLKTIQDSSQNTLHILNQLLAREKESTIRVNNALIGPFVVSIDAEKLIVRKEGNTVFSYQRGDTHGASNDLNSLANLMPVIQFVLSHEKILNSKNRLIVQAAQHASLLIKR